MNGSERRNEILDILRGADRPASGSLLAKRLGVSRQVIVQDVALLRAQGYHIVSEARGYVLVRDEAARRVFKVKHTPAQAEDEMNMIVDCGGKIIDVFVYHRVYGVIRAPLNVSSRLGVRKYMEDISSGKSSPLADVTSGYHYHTVSADSEKTLDIIQNELEKMGFLAKLQDYEPVDFSEQAVGKTSEPEGGNG